MQRAATQALASKQACISALDRSQRTAGRETQNDDEIFTLSHLAFLYSSGCLAEINQEWSKARQDHDNGHQSKILRCREPSQYNSTDYLQNAVP
jgi:hypothetical protein